MTLQVGVTQFTAFCTGSKVPRPMRCQQIATAIHCWTTARGIGYSFQLAITTPRMNLIGYGTATAQSYRGPPSHKQYKLDLHCGMVCKFFIKCLSKHSCNPCMASREFQTNYRVFDIELHCIHANMKDKRVFLLNKIYFPIRDSTKKLLHVNSCTI